MKILSSTNKQTNKTVICLLVRHESFFKTSFPVEIKPVSQTFLNICLLSEDSNFLYIYIKTAFWFFLNYRSTLLKGVQTQVGSYRGGNFPHSLFPKQI